MSLNFGGLRISWGTHDKTISHQRRQTRYHTVADCCDGFSTTIKCRMMRGVGWLVGVALEDVTGKASWVAALKLSPK